MPERASSKRRRARPFGLVAGAAIAILAGFLALGLGILGVLGKGGPADAATRIPNVCTGLAGAVGGIGYLALKRWAVPVYVLAAVSLVWAQYSLWEFHMRAMKGAPPRLLPLVIPPVVALAILISMEANRRRGVLT